MDSQPRERHLRLLQRARNPELEIASILKLFRVNPSLLRHGSLCKCAFILDSQANERHLRRL